MRWPFFFFALVLWLLVFANSAQGENLSDVQSALAAGHFEQAVQAGQEIGTPGALATAAEALNAKLMLGLARHGKKTAKQAMKLAEAALKLKPDHKKARLQYAIALGFYGRHVSSFTAWRKNLPPKIWAAAERAEAVDPDNPQIDALKGAWHLNMLIKAGSFNVEKKYGANRDKGVAYFKKALTRSPNDLVILSNYLMLLYVLEPETGPDIKTQIETHILPQTPRNEIERRLQAQIRQVYEGFSDGASLARARAFVSQ